MKKEARLIIKNLCIETPVVLAPMVGLSHSALRSLLAELGGIGLYYTEMLSVKGLPSENAQVSPYLIRSACEWPLFYQLALSASEPCEQAIERLHQLNAQGVDINLGCPAPQVRKFGGGRYLKESAGGVAQVIRCVKKCTELPLSVKIRLGKRTEPQEKFLDFCRMLENEGVDCITVHARFDGEKFCRRPLWEWIGEAKKNVHIPVIANGGIFSCDDARECLNVSGADGVMLGRGVVQKPWLAREISNALYGGQIASQKMEIPVIYRRFITLLKDRFPQGRQLGRLKEFTHYFSTSYNFGHLLAMNVQASGTMEEAIAHAEHFFERNETVCI